MKYLTKAHSMFAWAGFYCLLMFVGCLLWPAQVSDYLYSVAGPSGLAGIFFAVFLAGVATSLSTGLMAAILHNEEPEPTGAAPRAGKIEKSAM